MVPASSSIGSVSGLIYGASLLPSDYALEWGQARFEGCLRLNHHFTMIILERWRSCRRGLALERAESPEIIGGSAHDL